MIDEARAEALVVIKVSQVRRPQTNRGRLLFVWLGGKRLRLDNSYAAISIGRHY